MTELPFLSAENHIAADHPEQTVIHAACAQQPVPHAPRLIDASYLLPEPMPGETVRSIWERFHRISNSNSVKETLEVLFGPKARLRSGHCLPSRLAELSRRVGSDHALGSTHDVIEHHTTLPYHCYFHTTHQREHAFGCLLGERGPASARATLGLAKSPVLLDKEWPAFCPQCLAVDYGRCGFSYWRAVHQLPAVAVCPRHGCRLQQLEARRTNWSGYGYLPPPDLVEQDVAQFPFVTVDPRVPAEALLRVAQACLHAQERPKGFPGDMRNQSLSVLTLMGFKSKGGVKHAAIARLLEEKHGAPLLEWLGLSAPGKPMCYRPLKSMLGFQRARQPTILYIMLALAVSDDLPTFERISSASRDTGTGQALSNDLSPLVEGLLDHSGADPEFRLAGSKTMSDRSAARRAIFQLHRRVASRVDPIDDPEHESILADARSGATSLELRTKYRLHLSDLFMLLERDPAARRRMEQADFLEKRDEHRQRALDYLKANAALSGDELAAKLGHRFNMLRRYDVEWYRDHFPIPDTAGRRTEDPARLPAIDEKLSQQVSRVIRILIDDEGIQPTQGDVLARCRATNLFLRRRGSLPKTVAVLQRLAA